ncbi:MAG: cytochrome C [Oryzomonas sp.]|uniref:cytochrome C n=1 Tax=Oryzomonas sp. TaxID=2855186 RepID=UPI00284328D9|nr:cytochrome C [Oryzomonas sp.]MDR3578403.1 cytochrome C [Oryzomonas sp.]
MFNSLAGRALVPVGIAVTGFVVVCFLLLYSVIKNVVNRDTVGHATNLADTILRSTRYAMLKSDRETLTTIIQNIGQQHGVEHIRVFNKEGIVQISTKTEELGRQVDKKAEGCIGCHAGAIPSSTLGSMERARTFTNGEGREVLAVMAPIYNGPECFNAPCHFHPPSQKVLGTLDIGLSRQMLLKSLAAIRNQMIVFTVMILVLTVGGVTALLRRSVFLPLLKLRRVAEQVEAGEHPEAHPSHFPRELDRIAQSLYNLSQKNHNAGEDPAAIEKGTVPKDL